jgi:hypothetical protein
MEAPSWGERIILFVVGSVIGAVVGTYVKWRLDDWRERRKAPKQLRLKSLDGTYLGSSIQAERNDKCRLTLKTKGQDEISGTMEVNYQNDDGTWSDKPETMEITGQFLYDTLLLLKYINKDQSCKQAGVFSLNYLSNGKDLDGNWAGYYDTPPDGRKELKGKINFTRV